MCVDSPAPGGFAMPQGHRAASRRHSAEGDGARGGGGHYTLAVSATPLPARHGRGGPGSGVHASGGSVMVAETPGPAMSVMATPRHVSWNGGGGGGHGSGSQHAPLSAATASSVPRASHHAIIVKESPNVVDPRNRASHLGGLGHGLGGFGGAALLGLGGAPRGLLALNEGGGAASSDHFNPSAGSPPMLLGFAGSAAARPRGGGSY